MAKKKKKEPKVEKVFKSKDEEAEKVSEVVEEKPAEEDASANNVDVFLNADNENETPEDDGLTEKQRHKIEKINAVKSKISKILQSSNIEIVDENFDDDYESSDAPGAISQEDYDSLKSMYGGKDKGKGNDVTLTIDDFDYTYIGQYLEEYDLMHMKNIKRVKIQRKRSPKMKKFLLAASLVVIIAVGSVLAFLFTRKTPVYLKSVSLNQTERSYYIDERFDYTGLYFLAEYSDGEIKKVKLENTHFNNNLSTGKIERVGEENEHIVFVNNGTANLVFSYEGFNVDYEVTVKRKTDTGLSAIYSSGIFNVSANGYITEDLLKVFVNYGELGKEHVKYTATNGVSVLVDGVSCVKTSDGFKVVAGTASAHSIIVRYLSYELILDSSKIMVEV